MSHYSDGRRVEWAIRDHLTENGYDVMRASSSKSPAGDLAAFKPGQILFVNAKRTTMPPPAERAQLLHVAGYYPGLAVPLVALKPLRQPLEFRRLVGVGAREWVPWTVEEEA